MEETRSKAPVSAHAETDIAADVREVWTVIADIASWPTWNPMVLDVRFDAELETGSRFRFSTEIGTFRCHLVEVDAPRLLTWRGRHLTLAQGQTWRLTQQPEGTHVRATATMSGLGARLFRSRFARQLTAELDALLHLVRLEAETRATDRREAAIRATEALRREHADG